MCSLLWESVLLQRCIDVTVESKKRRRCTSLMLLHWRDRELLCMKEKKNLVHLGRFAQDHKGCHLVEIAP